MKEIKSTSTNKEPSFKPSMPKPTPEEIKIHEDRMNRIQQLELEELLKIKRKAWEQRYLKKWKDIVS